VLDARTRRRGQGGVRVQAAQRSPTTTGKRQGAHGRRACENELPSRVWLVQTHVQTYPRVTMDGLRSNARSNYRSKVSQALAMSAPLLECCPERLGGWGHPKEIRPLRRQDELFRLSFRSGWSRPPPQSRPSAADVLCLATPGG
jgi:hypothetical protein